MYCRTSTSQEVNEARYELFVKKQRGMEDIPPTKDALLQHLKRATFQGGHIWGRTLEVDPKLPSASNWGWTNPSSWKPQWSILPQASESIRELLRFGSNTCKCKKAGLKCTALCKCDKDCE